jgi:hypothetical protein
MMIVYVYYVWQVFPFGDPVHHRDLERHEPFRIIIIPIYFFPVQQAIDIYQVKFEPEFVGFLPDDGIVKPPASQVGSALMHYFPLIIVKEFGSIHGHHHFGNMAHIYLVFRKGAKHIS